MPDPAIVPLGLYVHLPWCLRKCPYCDFNSHRLPEVWPEPAYVDALQRDLERLHDVVAGRRFESVYFGGGTPSLFSPESIGRILSAVDRAGLLGPLAEITLETNPGAADVRRFSGFRAAGINRLSVGVQSFDDTCLRALGRAHDAAQAHRALELAVSQYTNVNVDLMHGLPGQTLAMAAADLARVTDSGAVHVSCYQLTLEPNTVFAKYPPELPDEAELARIEEWLHAGLAEAGYSHYEVSAHARPGFECRHNLNYWHFGDYAGLGAGAHSKLTLPDGQVWRTECRRLPATYLRLAGTDEVVSKSVHRTTQELLFEFMLNALRLRAGFSLDLLHERTGLTAGDAMPGLERARSRGLLMIEDDRVRPTSRGQRFLNEAIAEFLPD